MAGFATIGTEQLFQYELAQHDCALRAARALVYEAVADADAEARAQDVPGRDPPAAVRAAATYATHVATDAARFAYHWAGSAGLRPGIIQRCLRDMLAGSQHIYVDNNTLTGYAAALVADAAPADLSRRSARVGASRISARCRARRGTRVRRVEDDVGPGGRAARPARDRPGRHPDGAGAGRRRAPSMSGIVSPT